MKWVKYYVGAGCERPIQPAPRSVPAPRPPAPRSAPLHRFSRTPAHRSAHPLHPIFGSLRSVFRSAHAPLTCSAHVWWVLINNKRFTYFSYLLTYLYNYSPHLSITVARGHCGYRGVRQSPKIQVSHNLVYLVIYNWRLNCITCVFRSFHCFQKFATSAREGGTIEVPNFCDVAAPYCRHIKKRKSSNINTIELIKYNINYSTEKHKIMW